MRSEKHIGVFIVTVFNHATNEELQFEANANMTHQAQRTIQEVLDILHDAYPDKIQYLDFWSGYGYAGNKLEKRYRYRG